MVESLEDSSIVGVLDDHSGEEVYLSLIMIIEPLQKKGLGSQIYRFFENLMVQNGSDSMCIDVINDYPGNVMFFWEKLDFYSGENVELKWDEK